MCNGNCNARPFNNDTNMQIDAIVYILINHMNLSKYVKERDASF